MSRVKPSDVVVITIHGNGPGYDGDMARAYPWVELQIEQLRATTPPGVTVLAYGNALLPDHEDYLRGCSEVVYRSSREPRMPARLEHVWPARNWLITQVASEFKHIVMLDSDAFPTRAGWLDRAIGRLSRRCPLVAVQRLENGDNHSDRSFMAFTASSWRRYRFDYSPIGVVDAGAAISAAVENSGRSWHRMLRSNVWNPHPLIAGVYDDDVYHHAAGSRRPRFRMNRSTRDDWAAYRREREIHRGLLHLLHHAPADLLARLRGDLPPLELDVIVGHGRDVLSKYPDPEDLDHDA